MPRRRKPSTSRLLTTLGIISLVAGGLALLCGCIGTAGLIIGASGPGGGNRDMLAYLDSQAPAWKAIDGVRAISLLIMAFLLLAGGAGLLSRQPWARWLIVLAAAVGIPVYLLFSTYGIAKILPALLRYNEITGAAKTPGYNTGFKVGFLATFVPSTLFWIFVLAGLLIGCFTPAASEALRPPRRRRRHDEEFDDEDDRDRDDD